MSSHAENKTVDQLKNCTDIPNAILIKSSQSDKSALVAKDFAAKLQCKNGGCGKCKDCELTLSNSHPNVNFLELDYSKTKIGDIIEIAERAEQMPVNDKHRVAIITNFQNASKQMANYLLKPIEESAARTVWILTANMPVIQTIESRCRVLNYEDNEFSAQNEVIEYVNNMLSNIESAKTKFDSAQFILRDSDVIKKSDSKFINAVIDELIFVYRDIYMSHIFDTLNNGKVRAKNSDSKMIAQIEQMSSLEQLSEIKVSQKLKEKYSQRSLITVFNKLRFAKTLVNVNSKSVFEFLYIALI
jgi:DNA polymerase III delta prime subunit